MRLLGVVAALVLLVSAACGGSGQSVAPPATSESGSRYVPAPSVSSTSAPTSMTASPTSRVRLRLADYSIVPTDEVAPAGRITLAVENHDSAPHNVTVMATDRPADDLPTIDVRVDEADPTVAVVARSRTLGLDERDDVTIGLTPGRYVLVCTLPHHYVRNGMVATLVVQ